jgi:F-type H+-transporting ATPase subunit alpha
MKQVAGSIKLELAQYREMAAFAQFSSDLDASTQKLLNRGARLTELLKQPQFDPLPIQEQVVALFSGVKGYLDTIDLKDITRFEKGALKLLRREHSDILSAIAEEKAMSKETEEKLHAFFKNYVKDFV